MLFRPKANISEKAFKGGVEFLTAMDEDARMGLMLLLVALATAGIFYLI